MLIIVDTLRESRTISLGYGIKIHTNHKKLVHETSLVSSDYVTQWQVIIKEYGPKNFYIPGRNNIVTDALSRLPSMDEFQGGNYQKMYREIILIQTT